MNEDSNTEETTEFVKPDSATPVVTPQELPRTIGRYRLLRLLGQGGFGRVYLAHDDDLDRPVAIKVPNPERISRPEDIEAYLREARILASLDHPHIVPVHDVGRTDDGLCYVVSKFVEGSDLAARIRQSRPGFHESARLLATVAEALHYAHTRGLVHRDIKPANILIDDSGKPCVADFGLALKAEEFGKGARHAGTPDFMSPEQARGEGHRVDGRSDIFSLGVVFYVLLTGRKPFTAESQRELLDLIATTEARPLRQIDDTIPKELERICLKALSKRASERYTTARDMAEDLGHFLDHVVIAAAQGTPAVVLSPPPGSTQEITPPPITPKGSDSDSHPIKIVPKGLRSFDEHDAEFFLELLPGARDRDGLPDSLRFWKTRIETTDPDKTFRVGLIYGPSGCGKSSLMKAGLLPRLAKHVLPVYIEATPEETETRLLRALRKVCPDLSPQSSLVDSLTAIRTGRVLRSGQKVLLVLDQFEQWLHTLRGEENTELVNALRQCDGEHVQAVVLVRDDFWLAASRLMRELEIDLEPNLNIALVDLFDPRHARKVLTAFGTAYGNLSDRTAENSRDQHAFLDQATSELAQNGKIISVRLALFAEMVRGKPWTPATLREVGGIEGVGVTFLEETFSSPQANPRHRLHQRAAQAVLNALLPETGSDIKGQMRSEADLHQASGYPDHTREFADLIHILDNELRLITPTDPEGTGDERPSAASGGRYYQLTHDYLVHSLRDWLTRKQRETRRGRAELRLAERSSLWNARPENRHLPSLLEWANIRLLTRNRDWNEPQRRMLRRATRVHGLRTLVVASLIALLTWGGVEGYGSLRGSNLVESLRTASTSDVPALVRQLDGYRRWANPRLVSLVQNADDTSREKLHASLALLPVDDSQVPFLEKRLLGAPPTELPVIRDALAPHLSTLVPRLWSVLDSAKPGDSPLLPAASALASYAPNDTKWESASGKVALVLVSVNPITLGSWLEALRPVRTRLNPSLASIFRDKGRPESERALATNILTDYASDKPELLADVLMDSDPKAYATFFPLTQRLEAKTLPLFRSEILPEETTPEDDGNTEAEKDRLAERQARAAIALVRMGKVAEVMPLLRHSADPRLRSFIINWLEPLGADPTMLVSELDRLPTTVRPTPAKGQSFMDAILFHPETSQRRALILALGTYGTEGLSPGEREPLTGKLLDLYRNDPDSGIHGAAGWTLRKWKQQESLKPIETDLGKLNDWGNRRWFVNRQSQTYAVIEGPVEFTMGSPSTEPGHQSDESQHRRVIPRRFAIADREVSVEQYQRFLKSNPKFGLDPDTLARYSPDATGPMIAVNWFGATAYCNWLSEEEGLPKDQWCYAPNPQGEYDAGMTIPADVLKRTGYRLPTDAEWEYACRSGTTTSRYYGQTTDLLGNHAWYAANSQDHAWSGGSLIPNELGLFDIHGNAFEWVQDRNGRPEQQTDDINLIETVDVKIPRLLRGGTFGNPVAIVRSAILFWYVPSYRSIDLGFRPARTYP